MKAVTERVTEYEDALKGVEKFIWCTGVDPQLSRLRELSLDIPPPFQAIVHAFCANTTSLHQISSFPYLQNVIRIRERVLHPLKLAALIEAGSHRGEVTADEELNIEKKIVHEFDSTPENKPLVFHSSMIDLCYQLNDVDVLRDYCNEINRQLLVLIWSNIDVFLKDFIVSILNENACCAKCLIHDQEMKDLNIRNVIFDSLEKYRFNLSESMGNLLLDDKYFSNLNFVRSLCGALFGRDSRFFVLLKEQKLWEINKVRHLIVHRRGLIDQKYLSETSKVAGLGQRISVSGYEIQEYVGFSISLAECLVSVDRGSLCKA